MKLINANDVYYDNDFEKWYFEYDEDFENAQVVEDNYVKENQELKKQLSEKDREIKELKMSVLFEQEHKNKALDELKQLRKQICDEIFEELQENVDCYFEERKCNSPHSQLPYIWFNEIRFRKFLKQIEEGE